MRLLRRLRRCFAAAALFVATLSYAFDGSNFSDRLVSEVLAEYEARGYEFLYSTGTVRKGLRFSQEPNDGSPTDRLRVALAGLDLKLLQDSSNAFRIVRNTQRPARSAASELIGRVLDAETGLPIQGALVEIGNRVFVTNANGEFESRQGANVRH